MLEKYNINDLFYAKCTDVLGLQVEELFGERQDNLIYETILLYVGQSSLTKGTYYDFKNGIIVLDRKENDFFMGEYFVVEKIPLINIYPNIKTKLSKGKIKKLIKHNIKTPEKGLSEV